MMLINDYNNAVKIIEKNEVGEVLSVKSSDGEKWITIKIERNNNAIVSILDFIDGYKLSHNFKIDYIVANDYNTHISKLNQLWNNNKVLVEL